MDALESFQYLTYMALVDGELHKDEKPMLKKLGKRLGLSSEEMTKVLSAQKKDLKRPKVRLKDSKEGQALFKDLCRVALADHEIDPHEKKLLTKFGKAIGMDQDDVERYLNKKLEKSGEVRREPSKSQDKAPDQTFEKRDSFRYLCAMALADGVLDDEEVVILQKFGSQLGLSPEQRQEILNEQNRSKDPVKLPSSEDERQKLFRQVSKMALADEDVAAEEFQILARIGKSLGMGSHDVEKFLKKELKKQVHRAQSKDRAEASRLRSTAFKLGAVVILVIVLIGLYKVLEKTDKRLDALKETVAALDSDSPLSDFQSLKSSLNELQSKSPIAKTKEQAEALLAELAAKKSARAAALAKTVTEHIEGDRSDPSWAEKSRLYLEQLEKWNSEAPKEIGAVAQALKKALDQGDLWGPWGRKVRRELHGEWPSNPIHQYVFKKAKTVARQPITLETLEEELRRAEQKGTDAILLVVANIRFHPYLRQSYYQRRAAEAQEMLRQDMGKKHKDELIAFASRLKSCLVIGKAYKEALSAALKAAQDGQTEAALKCFESSVYREDAWFKAVISSLKNEAGQAFLKAQKK